MMPSPAPWPALRVTYYITASNKSDLDARVAYRVNDHLEVSLTGRNLLDASHPEYDFALNRRMTELKRSAYLICKWDY